MTLQEFSDEFDVLYNNISSNQAPGLDEYEKSVFLTKAQNEIVKNYFTATQGGNKYQEGFDGSQKRQIDFSTLIRQVLIPIVRPDTFKSPGSESATLEQYYIYGTAPEGTLASGYETALMSALVFVSERVLIGHNLKSQPPLRVYQVIPIKLTLLTQQLSKPYGRPLKRQVWRVVENFAKKAGNDSVTEDHNVYYLTGDDVGGFRFIFHDIDLQFLSDDPDNVTNPKILYSATILEKPDPIILVDLDNVSIEGRTQASECKLNSELHPEILQRAVELAKIAYSGDLKTAVDAGARSE